MKDIDLHLILNEHQVRVGDRKERPAAGNWVILSLLFSAMTQDRTVVVCLSEWKNDEGMKLGKSRGSLEICLEKYARNNE